MQETRRAYIIPLGSVFVWSVEGVVFSVLFVCAPPILQALSVSQSIPTAPKTVPRNVLDAASSIGSLVFFGIGMVAHLVIANVMNAKRGSITTGMLHMAVGNTVCTGIFVIACSYIVFFVDACVLESPYERRQACLALYESTPYSVMPKVVGAVCSVVLVLLLFVSIAMAYTCTPTFSKGKLFMSKACLMVVATQVGLGMPMLMASSTHVPCKQQIANKIYYICIGAAAFVGCVDTWLHDKRYLSVLWSIVVIICSVVLLTTVHTMPDAMKPLVGKVVSFVMFGCVIVWSVVDLIVRIRAVAAASSSSPNRDDPNRDDPNRDGPNRQWNHAYYHRLRDEDDDDGYNDEGGEGHGRRANRTGTAERQRRLELIKKYDGDRPPHTQEAVNVDKKSEKDRSNNSMYASSGAQDVSVCLYSPWDSSMRDALYGSGGGNLQGIFVSDSVRQSLRQRGAVERPMDRPVGHPMERSPLESRGQ